jgi:hypothetical protein
MKLDEFPPTMAVHILKYLSKQEQWRMQTLSRYFYAAVADAQLLERVRYYTQGYRETEALYIIYNKYDKSSYKFIIGVLYLAHSLKYKLNFHNHPRASVFSVGTPRSEFPFV